jgi:RNA polymerase sigma factor (TIGR02999 family)
VIRSERDVTELLGQWNDGDTRARNAAISRVYAELRRMARLRMRRERDAVTMQTTGLVHEAYLRLAGQRDTKWQNRAHFFAIAARVMRRILVESYRNRHAQKRGDPRARIHIDDVEIAAPEVGDAEGVALALERLEAQDERQARIVELRFFAGLTIEEIAAVLELSPATIKREWAFARAWLKREIGRAL